MLVVIVRSASYVFVCVIDIVFGVMVLVVCVRIVRIVRVLGCDIILGVVALCVPLVQLPPSLLVALLV